MTSSQGPGKAKLVFKASNVNVSLQQIVTDGISFACHFVVHYVGISLSLSSEVWEQTQSGIRGDEKKVIFPSDREDYIEISWNLMKDYWTKSKPEGIDEPSKDTVMGIICL